MSKQNDRLWRFWIDVGGTFTDCVSLSPAGRRSQRKTLSSGVVKASVLAWRSEHEFIVGPQLRGDRPGLWNGCPCRLLDSNGEVVFEARVESQDGDLVRLDRPFVENAQAITLELVSGETAPLVAIRRTLQLPLDVPPPQVDVRLGTTRGTNALLTRGGAVTGLLITKGFADLPLIGNQDRPRLFDLQIIKPQPLHSITVEVDERIDATGEVIRPLNLALMRRDLRHLRDQGVESLAICFLNAYRNPSHEKAVAEMAGEEGFDFVTQSHRVSALVKLVSRTDTSIVDAYLNPVLREYVERLERSIAATKDSQVRYLASSGGLVSGQAFSGKDSILSGPAGGVVGFSRTAEAAGFSRAIGFDMGGTSTDVSRYSGRLQHCFETTKAGVRIVAPMLAIETVAAGGGSICQFDGVRLLVGPASAGADPGPACYGRGGPLAVTDMNLILGRIPRERFPFALDREAVESKLDALRERITNETATSYTREELAEGFLRIANGSMSEAIRSISLAEGYDPREYLLAAFGGAAPQHACSVAESLGMTQILIHPCGGVLSAVGAGMADVVQYRERALYHPLESLSASDLERLYQELGTQALQGVVDEGVPETRIQRRRWIDVRYQGVDASLTLPYQNLADLPEAFSTEHTRRFGYADSARALEAVAARVEAVGQSDQTAAESRLLPPKRRVLANPQSQRLAYFAGRQQQTCYYDREQLRPGNLLHGPALIADDASTTVVEPGWEAHVMQEGELLLIHRETEVADRIAEDAQLSVADPIELELFNNRFVAIATQMGISLQSTSASVNVKERLDFSCALFAPDGGLIVNAPHIPVHLGAMSETVRCLLEDAPRMRPGDVYVTNDPYRGGSHLPDITVVTPVFDEDDGALLFLTASRAHHSEIGGAKPGSMPPFSNNLAEEGIVLKAFPLIVGGDPRFEALREVLLSGPFPSRAVDQNLADIRAQVAANQQGALALRDLMRERGRATVHAYMRHIQEAAATKVRSALRQRDDAELRFSDQLDCGAVIQVAVQVRDGSAIIDFAGTSDVLPGNLNANRAIVTAAVMYCLRCLLDEDIPLNQGVLDPVEIRVPKGCLLNPEPGPTPETTPAVVGGNVETSQRVVDVLLGAFGVAAASQGTMNNLLFGDDSFGYYETICGGSGATAQGPGADAVHTHMTNTRITDPEVFEQRLPARLLEFSIRQDSGGSGANRGGNGVVRRMEFLKQLELSLVTQRRGPAAPYGLHGGDQGMPGKNLLCRADGTVETLPASANVTVYAGDQLSIQTPGGGGWGTLQKNQGGEGDAR